MKKVTSIIIGICLFSSMSISGAHAESFTWQSSPLTNLDPAGSIVHGGFTNFPTKAGLYVLECTAPIGNARPATCSDSIQVWVTSDGAQGSTKASGDIQIKPTGVIVGKGVTVDCTLSSCGLFFRLDHTAPTDTSEDKFLPITFAKSSTPTAPAPATDEITVTLNGITLTKNVPANLAYRAGAKIIATSKSGAPVKITSSTAECTYAEGVLLALKGNGFCAIDVTNGNSSANFPFSLIPGTQQIAGVASLLKKGLTRTLPLETNFGQSISYRSMSKTCVVKGNLVKASSPGECLISATAGKKVGMWDAIQFQIALKIK